MGKEVRASHQTTYRELGIQIAYFRKKAGMNQNELAEKAGISRTFLSNIEAPGVTIPFSTETLFDIAEALGVTVRQLFDFDK